MDAFERCERKLDAASIAISAQCRDICSSLRDIRQYNRRTVLLIQILWGIGLPLTFFVSVVLIMRRGIGGL